MFTKGGLLFGFIVSILIGVIFKITDGMYLTITDGWTIQLHLELIWTCSFIASVFFIVMFILSILVGGLVSMPGLGTEEKEQELIFTKNELIQMDKEDEPHWNESHKWIASASSQAEGYGTNPVYTDYRGYLRDAVTDEYIGNNHEDQRNVINGKVSSRYEKLPDGRYKYVGSGK